MALEKSETQRFTIVLPTLILGVLLLISGIQLFFMGMNADMIRTNLIFGNGHRKPPRKH